MLKKLLLASSLIASTVAMQAKEIYIVKDGKVADGVELLTTTNKFIKVEEGVKVPGGEGTYLHYSTAKSDVPQYAGRFFYVEGGIDFNEAWMCDITYFFPEGSVSHGDNRQRESIRLDFLGDTLTVEGDTFKFDYNQQSRRFAHLGYDTYFRDFYKYNPDKGVAELKNQGVGMDRKLTRYIFTKSNFKDALGGDKAFTVSIACGQECPVTDSFPSEYYIKELKIYSDGVKPFYNETFHSFTDAAYVSGAGTGFFRYMDKDGVLTPFIEDEISGYLAKELYGCTYLSGGPISELNKKGKEVLKVGRMDLTSERLWQSKGEQCVDDIFYDTEVGIMLNMKSATDRTDGVSGELRPAYLRIPFTGAAAPGEKINVHLMYGHNACKECAEYKVYDKAASPVPLQYRFEKGDLNSYSEATSWQPYTTIDTLPINVTVVDEDITVPEGDYNIISLAFFPQVDVSYVIGDLQVRGSKTVKPSEWAEYKNEPIDFHKTSMPFSFEPVTALKNVNAIAALDIYPNPVSAEFTVGGDVEKVEVISMTGSVLVSSNSNTVNVKSLASGLYVVKAYTENGIKTGTIVKK